MRFHGYHKSAYFTHACGRCFPGATEATNNTEPVFVSESTCRPQTREQLAAPSNIHEWDGNTEGQCGAGDTGGEAASASVQRIMGLICITSGLLLFVRATVFCVCVCVREREVSRNRVPVTVCSTCSVHYTWEILVFLQCRQHAIL